MSAFLWHETLAPALADAQDQDRLLLRFFWAPG